MEFSRRIFSDTGKRPEKKYNAGFLLGKVGTTVPGTRASHVQTDMYIVRYVDVHVPHAGCRPHPPPHHHCAIVAPASLNRHVGDEDFAVWIVRGVDKDLWLGWV